MWNEFTDELRVLHLRPKPASNRPSVLVHPNAAYEELRKRSRKR